jgi:hypothetical protein
VAKVTSIVGRRAHDVAVERAVAHLRQYEMPEHMLEHVQSALADQPDAHRVWLATGQLLKQWLESRHLARCVVPGNCQWCGRWFEPGEEHWCAQVKTTTETP